MIIVDKIMGMLVSMLRWVWYYVVTFVLCFKAGFSVRARSRNMGFWQAGEEYHHTLKMRRLYTHGFRKLSGREVRANRREEAAKYKANGYPCDTEIDPNEDIIEF